jgi:hypothetical protein
LRRSPPFRIGARHLESYQIPRAVALLFRIRLYISQRARVREMEKS